jgi:tripartite ATP-independent transporter DctM subunit
MFVSFLLLIILRVPVSFALCFSVIPILFVESNVTPVMMLQRMMTQYGSFILLAIPFFLLAANLMNASGVTSRLIRLSRSIVGFLPGGLAHVNVVVSMIFAGISGSSNAEAAGIGSIIIPAMIKEGYDKRFTVALTACSAVMGVIIPPSIMMVVWGGVMDTSVGALFLAGIIPGIMIGVSQMVLVLIFSIKRRYSTTVTFSFKELKISLKQSVLALLTPIIIIGGIVSGFVTPTEAALIAVLYALLLSLIVYKTISLRKLSEIFLETGMFAAIIIFAVGAASIFGWVLAYYKIPSLVLGVIEHITDSPTLVLFIIVGIFLVVGTFLDAIPAIVIITPLLKPMAENVGINPIHFAIVGIISLAYGLITPPYGLCLLITSDIAGINCMEAMKEVGVFLLAMLLVLVLVIMFPNISLFLPKMFYPNLF